MPWPAPPVQPPGPHDLSPSSPVHMAGASLPIARPRRGSTRPPTLNARGSLHNAVMADADGFVSRRCENEAMPYCSPAMKRRAPHSAAWAQSGRRRCPASHGFVQTRTRAPTGRSSVSDRPTCMVQKLDINTVAIRPIPVVSRQWEDSGKVFAFVPCYMTPNVICHAE